MADPCPCPVDEKDDDTLIPSFILSHDWRLKIVGVRDGMYVGMD